MNNENKIKYDSSVNDLLENIKVSYAKWTTWEEGVKKFNDGLSVKPGRKFDKVMNGTSVWGFIAKTDGVLKGVPYFVGDVFKAASWRAPQLKTKKPVRGSIYETSTYEGKAGPYGGWLYQ